MAKELFSANDFVDKMSFEELSRVMITFFSAMEKGFEQWDKDSKEAAKSVQNLTDKTKALQKAVMDLSKANISRKRIALDQKEALEQLEAQIKANVKQIAKQRQEINSKNKQVDSEKKKVEELRKVYDEMVKVVDRNSKARKEERKTSDAVAGSIKDLKERQKELRKEIEATLNPSDALQKELKEVSKELNIKEEATKGNIKAAREEIKATNQQKTAYGALKIEARDAANAAKELGASLGTESKEFQEAAKRAKALRDELADIEGSVGQFQRNVGNYGSAIEGLKGGFEGILNASGAGGITDLIGGVGTAAGPAGIAVSVLVTGIVALGDALNQATKDLNKFATLTNKVGEDLQDFTANAQALSTTFDLDIDSVAKALFQAEKVFGETGPEAFDILSRGLVQAGAESEELLENITQFGQNATQTLGFSFEEFIAISSTAVQQGAKDVDRAGDLINNAAIELQRLKSKDLQGILVGEDLREAEKALTAFQSGAAKGTDTLEFFTQKAIDLREQGKLGESAELITKVFTAVGEEGLSDELLKTFTDIDGAVSKLTDNLTQAERNQIDLAKATRDANEALLEIGEAIGFNGGRLSIVFEQVKEAVFNAILFIIEGLQNAQDRFQAIFEAVFGGSEEASQALDTVGNALKSILDVIGEVFNRFNEAGGRFAIILEQMQILVAFFKAVGATAEQVFGVSIPELFDGVIESVKEVGEFFSIIFNGLSSDWESLVAQIREFSPFLEEIFIPFAGIIETIDELITDLGESLKALIPDEVLALISTFKTEFTTAYNDITARSKELGEARDAEKKAEEDRAKAASDATKTESKNIQATGKARVSAAKKINTELIKARQDLSKELLDIQISELEDALDNQEMAVQDRIDLTVRLGEMRKKQIEQNAEFARQIAQREIADAQLLAIELEKINAQKNNEIRQNEQETANEIKAINEELLEEQRRIAGDTIEIEKETNQIIQERIDLENQAFIDSLEQQIALNNERLQNTKMTEDERIRLMEQTAMLERQIIQENERLRLEALEREKAAEIKAIDDKLLANQKAIEKNADLEPQILLQNEELERQKNEIEKRYATERVVIEQEAANAENEIIQTTSENTAKVLQENINKRRELLGEIIGGGLLDAFENAEQERIANIEDENRRTRAQFALKLKMMALEIALAKIKNPDANVENQVAGLGRTGVGGLLSGIGQGFFKGGYTGDKKLYTDAWGHDVAALTSLHTNEWVANNKTLANPVTAPIIENLDAFQRTKDIRHIQNITGQHENFNGSINALEAQKMNINSSSSEIDYNKLASAIAAKMPKGVSVEETANSHIFRQEVGGKIKEVEVNKRIEKYKFG